ncbi:MAG: hypothetical protein ACXVJX_12605 [Acidimicrobiia bacterium]
MAEIGTLGTPWRASVLTVGAALAAEADGAHAFWLPSSLPTTVDPGDWATFGGVLARVAPDPDDLADPVVAATAAVLVARNLRIGVLGWEPGADGVRSARTVATLADVGPGRITLALDAQAEGLAALAEHLRPGLPIELAVSGDDPTAAARAGWAWIAEGLSAEDAAKRASDVGVTSRVGIRLTVVVHADAALARRAVGSGLLGRLGLADAPDLVTVGGVDALEAAIDDCVAVGIDRIVVDNLLAFGEPLELEGAQAATRAALRSSRLRHRGPSVERA